MQITNQLLVLAATASVGIASSNDDTYTQMGCAAEGTALLAPTKGALCDSGDSPQISWWNTNNEGHAPVFSYGAAGKDLVDLLLTGANVTCPLTCGKGEVSVEGGYCHTWFYNITDYAFDNKRHTGLSEVVGVVFPPVTVGSEHRAVLCSASCTFYEGLRC